MQKFPSSRRAQAGRRILWLVLTVGALMALWAEGVRVYDFYLDASTAHDSLLALESEVDLQSLGGSETDALAHHVALAQALGHISRARRFVDDDPLMAVARYVPGIGTQARGLTSLVRSADEAIRTGLQASEVAIAFTQQPDDPELTSIEEALAFLQNEREPMSRVAEGLARLREMRATVPKGLAGPLSSATVHLDAAIEKVDGLVSGYQRADALLPQLLGYESQKRYLVLPQNDTELFPSGGLISSYGIATFTNGRLENIDLEYFGTLFDRWQEQTGEYVEPPAPLKQYLKYGYSWGLGEAGWYPDFPTTAELARTFVSKGGAPATDGTIAVDLQFIQALVQMLGPVEVPDYGVTVTRDNVIEVTLELTRDETYVPGHPAKAFLSFLARSVMERVFSVPKDQWVDMLKLLDRMGRERHLQLYFVDPSMQETVAEYGLDGALVEEAGSDFLMLADTSVNSTKLNLILDTAMQVNVTLKPDGSASTRVSYSVGNPFPDWREGRDPKLVRALMLEGVYGSYVRVYASAQARLRNVRVDGETVGAEQSGMELGRKAFGRYFLVKPGTSSSIEVSYDTPGVVYDEGQESVYRLYVQKEAGTSAVSLTVVLTLPEGAKASAVYLDGRLQAGGLALNTDLRTDRSIEVRYRQ